ncbi:hypothetical protein GCM10009100_38130 [Thalassospira tepidiphila]|jgi:hypothetical protein
MKIDWPIDDDRMYVTLQCKYTGLHLSVRKLEIMGKRIKWLILPLHESETDRHLIGLSG